jgi:hypothetical protein
MTERFREAEKATASEEHLRHEHLQLMDGNFCEPLDRISPEFAVIHGTFPAVDEELIWETVTALVSTGLAAAGYTHFNLDDAWSEPERENGKLVGNRERFPSGIKSLADFVHSQGDARHSGVAPGQGAPPHAAAGAACNTTQA